MPSDFLSGYKNKKIGFVGSGISNLPVALLMRDNGIDVTLRDKKEQTGDFEGMKCVFGDAYLDGIDEDILFLAPAVNERILPQICEARRRGVRITTELEEFFTLCPCATVAVTGSDGKTTTTTLIAKILEHSGKKVFLGGNIGSNLFCRLPEITAGDWAVCELSSFQLIKMNVSPHIAVLKNIAPNHLDWHRDMDEYIDAKKNIFRFQKPGDVCVLSADNSYTASFGSEVKGRLIYTSGAKTLADGVYYNSDGIYAFGEKYLDDSDIFLVGVHNRNNYADAIAATYGLVSREDVLSVAKTFTGVKHRVQFVREVGGVKYYNSSIDSSPSRTYAALHSFAGKVIVICGGYDKKIPYEPLGELFCEKAKAAITMGATGGKIREVLANAGFSGKVESVGDMAEAVAKAAGIASSGDVVILSPASASFDLYKNFEQRGDAFIDEVNKL